MSPEEYMDKRELLLKQWGRCKNEEDMSRLQSKIDALDVKYDFSRRHIGRPEQKLQQYGVV